VALVRQRTDLTLVPPAGLKLSLDRAEGKGAAAEKPRSHQPPAISYKKGASRSQSAAPSWWTARARAGEVKPGFSKEEILRPAKEDPRAAGGVFEQVGGLLSDLLDQR
jgi:hypothetical protein